MTTPSRLELDFEQLERLYRGLADLRENVLPADPRLFAVMAEGPLQHIRRIQEEIDEYAGARQARELEADFWVRMAGAEIEWPDAPSSVLASVLDKLRKGVQAVAVYVGGRKGRAGGGRPPERLKEACDFAVAGLAHGSLSIGLRLPEPRQIELPFEDRQTAETALADYLAAAEWAAGDHLPRSAVFDDDDDYRRLVFRELKRLAPTARGAVEQVEFSGRRLQGRAITLTREAAPRIDEILTRTVEEQQETYEGRLREIDLDRRTFILRDRGGGDIVRCNFEEELQETVKDLLDQPVRVTGFRHTGASRSAPLLLMSLESAGTA